ncbi:uncharacterized protein LOC117186283 [Drosophila miranda]|uniref:uncharacterized protein LOC117186283 n=1 Tax=Drosophila miranda TaxID=7229 RepID=UPI00143F93A5|nr:uncharacterized protein LOC117186283 [Drosophila miranda]
MTPPVKRQTERRSMTSYAPDQRSSDLAAVVLNWRFHRFVFAADIQKMYSCIDMNAEDSQYQRIFWHDEHNQVAEYFLNTVTFGTASAPYTVIRVIHQLAQDERDRYPIAERVLRHEIYVDDVQSGSSTREGALEIQNQSIGALRSAGMELRKLSANDASLLQDIPPDHLSLARLYDPLGFITPCVMTAKAIFKDSWMARIKRNDGSLAQLDWDEPLPTELLDRWQGFNTDLAICRANSSTTMAALQHPRACVITATCFLRWIITGVCSMCIYSCRTTKRKDSISFASCTQSSPTHETDNNSTSRTFGCAAGS